MYKGQKSFRNPQADHGILDEYITEEFWKDIDIPKQPFS